MKKKNLTYKFDNKIVYSLSRSEAFINPIMITRILPSFKKNEPHYQNESRKCPWVRSSGHW